MNALLSRPLNRHADDVLLPSFVCGEERRSEGRDELASAGSGGETRGKDPLLLYVIR